MRMALAVFITLLIAISSVTFAATAPELHISGNEPERARNGFDPAAFRSLPDADKLAFAIAKLKQRESELANLSYNIEETTFNNRIRGGTGRRFMSRQDWEYRRLGRAYWLKQAAYESDPPHLFVRQSSLTEFDDVVTKSTPDPEISGVHFCSITPGESRTITNCQFDQLLGFHGPRIFREAPVPLVDWLEKKGDVKRKITVTAEDLHDAPPVRINIVEGKNHWDYWLDPARDFMIERIDEKFEHGADYNRWSNQVKESTRIAGVWIPKKAFGVAGASGSDEESEWTFLATNFQIGQVREQELHLQIPAHAKIFDQVRNISYEPLPDGTFRLLPLRDIQGLLHVPPTDPIVKHIDDETAKAYTVQEDLTTRMLNRH